nr:uncharacterized protein DDB_G0287625-like [Maniola hyperantus]
MSNRIVNKKQKLLSRKEELLKELKYYETRIEDARASANIPNFYEDDSSDSEIEFSINTGTSVTELKLQRSGLLTGLRATEELTGVTVLQSELNIVLNVPDFEGEAPITEDGLWREVMAECRIDLVTFSMTFYAHQPSRQFAPVSYRGLNVMPTKLVHEKELTLSVLPTLTTPSDAVEVLRSYAHAHRSRRSTLARLAEKYADSLFMETLPEGGYVLKCAKLLRASWTLQNKWSQVAPFYHKLTFDLEYMDETYIKTIMQAHKQLCDPALDTDDRTLLLAEIIDTCLEARRQIGPDSDADSQNSKTNQKSDVENQNSKRPSDQEMDAPIKSSEIMGPPKSLPKKSKAKGKENIVANEKKRASDMDGGNEGTTKKAKTDAMITNVKDKIDKNSANSKNSNKKSSVSENVNSKITYIEEVVENAYFSKNEPENVNKGNKKTKNLPKVDTESKNTEVVINTDAVKAKDSVTSKDKSSSAKSSENKVASTKNDKNNVNLKLAQNKKVAEKELKTKNKSKKGDAKTDAKSSENKVLCVKNDKNNDNFKTTDIKKVAEKELKTKDDNSKKANDKTDAKSSENKVISVKNDKNNDNLKTAQNKKVAEKVSAKMISVEKQSINPKNINIDEENAEKLLLTQSVNPNFKAAATKNVKTKPIADDNEPKTKKPKMSILETNKKGPTNSENIVTQPKNSNETAQSTSKEKLLPKAVAEKTTQKSDKNVAKQNQKNIQNQVVKTNLVSTNKQQNFDNHVKQNEKFEPNQDLKVNTNNKKVQSKENSTQSKTSNTKNDLTQKPKTT